MWHPARRPQQAHTTRRPGTSHHFIAFLFAMCLLWPSAAHAYLDPATGSYVVQMIIAMLVSISFVLKRFWSQLVSFCQRLFSGPARKDRPQA